MAGDDAKRIKLRVRRGRPGAPGSPRVDEWTLDVSPDETVLDALETIRLERDPTLLYRQGCHHGSCGTCGCRIDGVERLACVTRFDELGETVTVEPLAGFEQLGDLLVDVRPLYRHLEEDWATLRASEGDGKKPRAPGVERLTRLEDCIECGCCQSVCPVTSPGVEFLGPAALAALARQRHNAPESALALLRRAGEADGVPRCERAIDCSRRCPTGVSPARHIAELRRALEALDE